MNLKNLDSFEDFKATISFTTKTINNRILAYLYKKDYNC